MTQDERDPNHERAAAYDAETRAIEGDLPGLADDVPPSGDLTPADAATRAEAPGLRQDPAEPRFVPASEDDAIEVDVGSPQDYGDANDDVVRR